MSDAGFVMLLCAATAAARSLARPPAPTRNEQDATSVRRDRSRASGTPRRVGQLPGSNRVRLRPNTCFRFGIRFTTRACIAVTVQAVNSAAYYIAGSLGRDIQNSMQQLGAVTPRRFCEKLR